MTPSICRIDKRLSADAIKLNSIALDGKVSQFHVDLALYYNAVKNPFINAGMHKNQYAIVCQGSNF